MSFCSMVVTYYVQQSLLIKKITIAKFYCQLRMGAYIIINYINEKLPKPKQPTSYQKLINIHHKVLHKSF